MSSSKLTKTKTKFKLAPLANDRTVFSLITTDTESQISFQEAGMKEITIISSLTLYNEGGCFRKEQIQELIKASDMLFVVVDAENIKQVNHLLKIAEVSKKMEIITLVITTLPFQSKDEDQFNRASQNIAKIKLSGTTVLVIPIPIQQRENLTANELMADKHHLIVQAIRSVTELMTNRGLLGVDMADIKAVISCMGEAMMGTGVYKGNKTSDRAKIATEKAINSATLNKEKLATARGILVNMLHGMDINIDEYDKMNSMVKEVINSNATTLIATSLDKTMVDEIRVSIIATGLTD